MKKVALTLSVLLLLAFPTFADWKASGSNNQRIDCADVQHISREMQALIAQKCGPVATTTVTQTAASQAQALARARARARALAKKRAEEDAQRKAAEVEAQRAEAERRQAKLAAQAELQKAQLDIAKQDAETRRMQAQAELNNSQAHLNAVEVDRLKVQSDVAFATLAEEHAKKLDDLGDRYMTMAEKHQQVGDRNDTIRLVTEPVSSFLFGGLGNIFRRADRFNVDQKVKGGDTSLSSSSTSTSSSTASATATQSQTQKQDQDQQQKQGQQQGQSQSQPQPKPSHPPKRSCD